MPTTAVLAAYGIDPRRTTIQPMVGGHAALTWRLDSLAGRVVLHQLADNLTRAQAALASAAHDHAALAGLAPEVVRNRRGDLVTEHNDHRYCLTAYVDDAAPLSATPQAVNWLALGHHLGWLHVTLAAIPVVTPWRLPDDGALQRALAAHRHPGCTHQDALRTIIAKLDLARTIDDPMRQRLDALPQQIIHGDIHPGNVLIRQDGMVSTVIDFDLARASPPGYELVRSLIYCTRPAGTPDAYAVRVAEFLRGYFTARPLTGVEIHTMMPLYEAVQILDPYAFSACENADPSFVSFGHARLSLLYWIRRNHHSLTALAQKALDDAIGESTPRRQPKD